MKKIEIVAPAGNMDRLKAAIQAGANDIYLGLKGFGARKFAVNFTVQELLEAIDYAHLRGVKLLLTLNTVMKDVEIEALHFNLTRLYEAGLDAIIVQDMGMFKFIKENFPKIEIHASTQMTVANHYEANHLKELGFKRVVLARELSFEEIKTIRENTKIELEIFVSGSLCISYSGNCYLSSFIGGRSGNRGMCAYSCRKEYTTNEDCKHFLSPKDQLMTQKEIKKLQSIGIDSIKVEGRMKSPEYVFETVNFYRNILDENPYTLNTPKLFNRGYSKGYFYGYNKELMNIKYTSNYGYNLGVLKSKNLTLTDDIKLGDGIAFLDKNLKKLEGTYINKIFVNKQSRKEAKIGETIYLSKMPFGTKFIYKTFDKKLNESVTNKLKTTKRQEPIDVFLKAKVGEKLELTFKYKNNSATCYGDILEEAKREINFDTFKQKLSELGDTTFYLNNFTADIDNAFVSFKTLKEIKRHTAIKLANEIISNKKEKHQKIVKTTFDNDKENEKPTLAVCVKTKEQEKAAIEMGIKKIYFKQFDVAKEDNLSKIDLNSRLASNLYQAICNKNSKFTLDWNLNITNSYSLKQWNLMNVDVAYISPELSYNAIKEIKGINKGLVVYGYLTGMYIEQKIFEKKYQVITNYEKDKFKVIHNKLGNTELYFEKPMNLIPRLDDIYKLGLKEIRLDFVFESYEEVLKIIKSISDKSGEYTSYAFERGIL